MGKNYTGRLFSEHVYDDFETLKREFPNLDIGKTRISESFLSKNGYFEDFKDIMGEAEMKKGMHVDDFLSALCELKSVTYEYTDVCFSEREDKKYNLYIKNESHNEIVEINGVSEDEIEKFKEYRDRHFSSGYSSLSCMQSYAEEVLSRNMPESVTYTVGDTDEDFIVEPCIVQKALENSEDVQIIYGGLTESDPKEVFSFKGGSLKEAAYTDIFSKNPAMTVYFDKDTFEVKADEKISKEVKEIFKERLLEDADVIFNALGRSIEDFKEVKSEIKLR